MQYNKEQHNVFIKDGEPVAFIRFDEASRKRVIYICSEADDEQLEKLFKEEI